MAESGRQRRVAAGMLSPGESCIYSTRFRMEAPYASETGALLLRCREFVVLTLMEGFSTGMAPSVTYLYRFNRLRDSTSELIYV